ncbi:MAG TPA: RES family NAD+ phosphorylase [Candidatus Aquilonibacter sp.]|nr:RES family NAD+ phosphorylase [Candidatus Aquilonibacter sp.]
MASKLPPTSLVRVNDTHRLVPTRFEASVLNALADSDEDFNAIVELDAATNDRILAEHGRLPGIGIHELVFGVPYYRIVNAAFAHPHPLGGRFNSPERGAWYASLEIETSLAEVVHRHSVDLAEIGVFEDEVSYRDYLADFSAQLHDLRGNKRAFATYLDPDSYVASQALAEELLRQHSLGVIYPSVRRKGGTCLACFRPAVVANVREGASYKLVWSGSATPVVAPMS